MLNGNWLLIPELQQEEWHYRYKRFFFSLIDFCKINLITVTSVGEEIMIYLLCRTKRLEYIKGEGEKTDYLIK
jgi:hypothetical protein